MRPRRVSEQVNADPATGGTAPAKRMLPPHAPHSMPTALRLGEAACAHESTYQGVPAPLPLNMWSAIHRWHRNRIFRKLYGGGLGRQLLFGALRVFR